MKMMIRISVFLFLLTGFILGQHSRKYEGPDDPASDPTYVREARMTGNRVLLLFKNTTMLSDWPRANSHKWPNNYDGCHMADGITLMIGARVYIENNNVGTDSTVVDDINEIKSRDDLDTLYFCQTTWTHSKEVDWDPTGNIEWGLKPVPGYCNPTNEYVAMSNLPESWPLLGWPSRPGEPLKWKGEWNGRFGRGVTYADQESFFVVNDAHDQEYLEEEDTIKYYPRGDLKLGDKRDQARFGPLTVQNGKPWGGIGVRVEVRGFQWNNPQARDVIFWEYNIANVSEYDLPEVCFGYYVDNGIGENGIDSDATDELGYFNDLEDMAYSWDIDGVGFSSGRPGVMGFAYLESPGKPFDGKDNDMDGLTDEKRDNIATMLVGPTDGISNLEKFLTYYGYKEEVLKEHWDADEDQDWIDGEDLNGDGVYQLTENYGDDIGTDGVAPGELNYNGPDANGTECNHKPDFIEGVGCEPNFAATDVSESDMIGLTAFEMWGRGNSDFLFKNDNEIWNKMSMNALIPYAGEVMNLVEFFASGEFPLYKGLTERVSMSLLHSYDPIEGLNSEDHTAPALFKNKKIVQLIYDKDYRFAQPPKMPTLKATPLDGKVVLTWDDMAEKSRDPFLNYEEDFEGYKLFRATDKKFSDCEVITDGYGTPMFKKPIFECDLKDEKQGFAEYGNTNGMLYYLGSDKGISHYYVDNNVQNGRTYYYGLVAYDYGAPDVGDGVSPSENNLIIELDESETIRNLSKNVQVVVPRREAAGYVAAEIDIDEEKTSLTGTPEYGLTLEDPSLVKQGTDYVINFLTDTLSHLRPSPISRHPYDRLYVGNGFIISRLKSVGDSVVKEEILRDDSVSYTMNNLKFHIDDLYWYFNDKRPIVTELIDGIKFSFNIPFIQPEFSEERSGWFKGKAPITVQVADEGKYFSWDYNIVFTGEDSAYTSVVEKKSLISGLDGVYVGQDSLLLKQSFPFYVENVSFTDSVGKHEKLDLVVYDLNGNGAYDLMEDVILCGHPLELRGKVFWGGTVFCIGFENLKDEREYPQANDVYHVRFDRPYTDRDSIVFRVNPEERLNKDLLKKRMEDIKVVPNPYVATNSMEPAVGNYLLNQRRQLMFTSIPARCEIKIFTVSGILVDEIDVDWPERVETDENGYAKGIVHWDMKSKEGLEIAAGMYIYHVKSKVTGDEKIGKFGVIK